MLWLTWQKTKICRIKRDYSTRWIIILCVPSDWEVAVQDRDTPIVLAIFQGIGIGTLKISPIFPDTDTLIFLIEK